MVQKWTLGYDTWFEWISAHNLTVVCCVWNIGRHCTCEYSSSHRLAWRRTHAIGSIDALGRCPGTRQSRNRVHRFTHSILCLSSNFLGPEHTFGSRNVDATIRAQLASVGCEPNQSWGALKQKKAPRGRRSALEGHVCYLGWLTMYDYLTSSNSNIAGASNCSSTVCNVHSDLSCAVCDVVSVL